jgi:hypothetical protein
MHSQPPLRFVFDVGDGKRLHVREKEAREHDVTFQPMNPKLLGRWQILE